MAEASTLAKYITKNFLECPICIGPFQDPRVLPCYHGFCKECLKELVASTKKKRSLVCPTCRKTVKLPKDGVHGLPVYFIVRSLQDTVNMETKGTVPLDKAATMKSADLDRLAKKCDITLKNYQEAVKTTQRVESELEVNSQQAKQSLQKVKKEYIDHLEKMVTKHEAEINRIKKERLKELDKKKTSLESAVRQIKKAKEHTSRVTKSGSDHEVLTNHATLATQLQELSQSKPQAADKSLAYVKFEAAIPTVPSIGQLLVGTDAAPKWKQSSQFSTGDFNKLEGLAIDQDGDIALASWNKGARVYSRSGRVKCTLYDSPGALDVAVTHDHKYVSIPKGEACIKFHDIQGNQLSTTPIKDINNEPSAVNSVAIDTEGRIIVGQCNNTISIHHPDGALISKFATQSLPLCLATTSNGEIVTSIYDPELKRGTSVQLMDYSGGNVRVLQPPPDVKVWAPSYVCCRQGEIFVVNPAWVDPTGVYRYTSEGEYLGCVTTDVANPTGIALTDDGMELFVADYYGRVKIFQLQ